MEKNTIFGQVLQLLSRFNFQRCVNQHQGDRYTKKLNCWQQFIVMLFVQAKGLSSLRDVCASFSSFKSRWYHLGLQAVARSTLSDANNKRSCDIFREIFYDVLTKCQSLSPKHQFRFKNPLFTMDATLIQLCLSAFPWARYRKRKGALKLHTLLDHDGHLPAFLTATHGRVHELQVVRDPQYAFPALPPDSILTIDRGYLDFPWLFSLDIQGVGFIIRAKKNLRFRVTGQHKPLKKRGVISDQTIKLTGFYPQRDYPKPLRLIRFRDKTTRKCLSFLTNNFELAAATVAALYKARWQVELFYKWIKQHLKVKTFLGASQNAVMTQIWIAMIYYLLLSFVKFQSRYAFSLLDLTRTIRDLLMDRVSLIEILRQKYDKLVKTLKPPEIQLSLWQT